MCVSARCIACMCADAMGGYPPRPRPLMEQFTTGNSMLGNEDGWLSDESVYSYVGGTNLQSETMQDFMWPAAAGEETVWCKARRIQRVSFLTRLWPGSCGTASFSPFPPSTHHDARRRLPHMRMKAVTRPWSSSSRCLDAHRNVCQDEVFSGPWFHVFVWIFFFAPDIFTAPARTEIMIPMTYDTISNTILSWGLKLH